MPPSDDELRRILASARTIAVVGLSNRPERDSFSVGRYLRGNGYRVIPVNPTVPEVFGQRSYPSLSAIPDPVSIDIADIFRRPDQVPATVEEAIARHIPVVWMQLGVEHAEAAARARAAGATVIENRCIRTEHQRLGIRPVAQGS